MSEVVFLPSKWKARKTTKELNPRAFQKLIDLNEIQLMYSVQQHEETISLNTEIDWSRMHL